MGSLSIWHWLIVLLVVVLLHLMAFHVFQHLQLAPWLRSAPAHRESSVRTITIALLPNEPVRAIPDRKDRVKPQDRNSRNAPVAESLRQVTEPLPASEVVGTRLMWEPASAPAKPASALRLDAQVIREAVSNAGRGGVRDVARKAGRSQELDAEPVDRLATTMSSARMPKLMVKPSIMNSRSGFLRSSSPHPRNDPELLPAGRRTRGASRSAVGLA